MIKQCKHCASPYPQSKGRGEFCCAGCEHVFELIREGGLDDYYELQDRAGEPVGNRPFVDVDDVSMKQLQLQAEKTSECEITVSVEGMSCLGCAWLIEQLARRQKGVRFAAVALNSNRLSLAWDRGVFDLCAFAGKLHDFGYRIRPGKGSGDWSWSPLTIRLMLTLVFSVNGLLLLLASGLDAGGAELQRLYRLLSAACLLFAQFIGAAVFMKPAWRGLLIRRVHRDLLPACLLVGLFLLAFISLFLNEAWQIYPLLYFLLLPLMVCLRWCSEKRTLRATGPEACD